MTRLNRFASERIDLEREADELLARAPRDPERPCYTERQLARSGARVDIRRLAARITSPVQPLRDEVLFLSTVSRLDKEDRRFLRLWLDGWSQREIAEALRISQQFVSQRLKRALRACFDMAPLSFRRFSHHTVYRAPRGRREPVILRVCIRCRRQFDRDLGIGRFCSEACRDSPQIAAKFRKKSPEKKS